MQAAQVWLQYISVLSGINLPTLLALQWVFNAAKSAFAAVSGGSLSIDCLFSTHHDPAVQRILIHLAVPLLVLLAMVLIQVRLPVLYTVSAVLPQSLWLAKCCLQEALHVQQALSAHIEHLCTHLLASCKEYEVLYSCTACYSWCVNKVRLCTSLKVDNDQPLRPVQSATCMQNSLPAHHRWAITFKQAPSTPPATASWQTMTPSSLNSLGAWYHRRAELTNRLGVTLLKVVYFYYPSLLATILSLFACYPIDPATPGSELHSMPR